jgi:hypothetical protein
LEAKRLQAEEKLENDKAMQRLNNHPFEHSAANVFANPTASEEEKMTETEAMSSSTANNQ